MARAILLSCALVAALISGSARACSVGNPPAHHVAERIAGRTDLHRVTGILRIERMEPGATVDDPWTVYAKITTARGASLDVVYQYDELWVSCLIYYLPRGDAEGIFYLSAVRRAGRTDLEDWDGKYIPGTVINSPY